MREQISDFPLRLQDYDDHIYHKRDFRAAAASHLYCEITVANQVSTSSGAAGSKYVKRDEVAIIIFAPKTHPCPKKNQAQFSFMTSAR